MRVAVGHEQNLEATIRLARMDLSELKGLPLPKECNGNGNCAGKCRKQKESRTKIPKKGERRAAGDCQGQAEGRRRERSAGRWVVARGDAESWCARCCAMKRQMVTRCRGRRRWCCRALRRCTRRRSGGSFAVIRGTTTPAWPARRRKPMRGRSERLRPVRRQRGGDDRPGEQAGQARRYVPQGEVRAHAAVGARVPIAARPDEKAEDARPVLAQDVVAGRWEDVAKAIASFEKGRREKALQVSDHRARLPIAAAAGAGRSPTCRRRCRCACASSRCSSTAGRQGGGGGGGAAGGPYLLPQDFDRRHRAAPCRHRGGADRAARAAPLARDLESQRRRAGRREARNRRPRPRREGRRQGPPPRRQAAHVRQSPARSRANSCPPLKEKLHDNDPKLLDLTSRHLIAHGERRSRSRSRVSLARGSSRRR